MDDKFLFSSEEKNAIYRVIRERRDVRKFRSDPIPIELLHRIIKAAMHAPSVGYMQPWNFIVISDLKVRNQVYDAFVLANEEARDLFLSDERKKLYSSLKLEGILGSALNICITCDRNRFGPVVLGKTCQPEMD
ncbi:MAG: nitroreductase family protein, partial [Bdellovibrionia bacterium]